MQRYLNKRYKLVKSENFDDYLKHSKIRLFFRKLAHVVKPVVKLSEQDGKYSFTTLWGVTETAMIFRPGVPFSEVRVDGSQVKSLVEFQDNKMIHTQVLGDFQTVITREFSDKQLKATITCGDIVVTRWYDRIPDKK